MFSIFGETGSEIFDVLIKLAPAASIVGGIFAARYQLINARRMHKENIAKTYYREMLTTFLENSDILYEGIKKDGFDALKKDAEKYRRYRMLYTIMGFSIQELYLSIDKNNEQHWLYLCRSFVSMFRHFILSPEDYTPALQKCAQPEFGEFMLTTAREFEHASANTVAALLTVRA